MSIIRERIELLNNDIKLKFSLSNNTEFTGQQQEIDRLTQFNTFDIVNPPVDGEKNRFTYPSNENDSITFQFYSELNKQYVSSFNSTMFTVDETSTINLKTSNSFFIMDFYDSFNTYNQNRIFSTYLTKIIGNTSTYLLSRGINQWNKIAIPNWFINQHNTNEITGYTKFTFYNAKTGRLVPFFNLANNNVTTLEKYYVRTILNISNWSYRFVITGANQNNIIFREIDVSKNQRYIDKVNDTVNRFNDLRITYPMGNAFNPNTRNYETT